MLENDENLVDRKFFYDLLRILLVSFVVIGHGTYYNIVTPFGGIHYSELMQQCDVSQ